MEHKTKPKTVDEYFDPFPKNVKSRLKIIRKIIREETPEAQEILSYHMPAFRLNKKILVYFAAHKEHIGFYPMPGVIKEFKKELSPYRTSKGTIQFSLDKPLPSSLIRKIIKFRARELLQNKQK